MKNPIQPDIEITLPDPMKGGTEITFLLQFDFEAIAEAEEATGRPLLMGLTRRQIDQPQISFVRGMLFAALLRHEPKITYQEAAAFVTRQTMLKIWAKLLEAWVASAREGGEDQGHPTTAQS